MGEKVVVEKGLEDFVKLKIVELVCLDLLILLIVVIKWKGKYGFILLGIFWMNVLEYFNNYLV